MLQYKQLQSSLQTVGIGGAQVEFSRDEAVGETAPECFVLLSLMIHECPKCPNSLTVSVSMPFVIWLFSPPSPQQLWGIFHHA